LNGVEAVDGLGQHRVAEAVHVGELGEDRRVDRGVVTVGGEEPSTCGWMVRANSSNTRCWYCISVPNLAAWNSRSPSPPGRRSRRRGRQCGHIVHQPFVEEGQVAEARMVSLVCATRRLCSEWNTVHGGQADVLVDPAVAGDVVGVEQFVVVGQVVAAAGLGGVADALSASAAARRR
jgi:hypothetical protein